MAESNLLSCLEKRDLLNRSAVSIEKLLEWGKRYETEGMVNDAADFYERAAAVDHLEKLLPLALAEGDSFLFGRILKALKREATPEEWIALGEKARELGKEAYAREAFKRGGLQTVEIITEVG